MNVSSRRALMVFAVALTAGACVSPLEVFSDDNDEPRARIGSEAIDSGTSFGDAGSDPLADTDPFAATEWDLEFDEEVCRFAVPEGFTPRCGTVIVPADWARDEGRVELAVAVFAGNDDGAEPVVYLDGGPGSHSLDAIEFGVEDFLEPLLSRGDVVFFDQRGVGLTNPRLDCSETTELTRRLEDDPLVGDSEARQGFHDALAECRRRLLDSGIDLTDYNSISNAHDVEAIRRALGYDSWNLFGISYGTKLGLEVLRRHPQGVRAAVLDSVYPPQVDSVAENPSTFLASYERVVAACAQEPACAADGDLAERIRALVARYEAEPVLVEVRDWILDESDEVYADGETIVGLITGALYSPSQFTDLPELVTELESGRTEALASFLSQDRSTERFFTDGMFYAIACQEEISFADRDTVAAAVPADPFGLDDAFDFASNTGNLAFGTCEAFPNGQAPTVSNSAVQSDVPTLLMAGVYDPVTPVAWAERAAETLTRSQLVIGPVASHGVSGGRCGISIVLEFLDAPDRSPNDDCLFEQSLTFVASASDEVELEAVTYRIEDFGVEISTVRPADWLVGSLEGDQYRRESFLDPTELYQLAGDPSLGFVLAEFIEDEQGVSLGATERFVGAVGPLSADQLTDSWNRRSGRSGSVAVEWFEREVDGLATYVVLVSTIEQLDAGLEQIVEPALLAIDVTDISR